MRQHATRNKSACSADLFGNKVFSRQSLTAAKAAINSPARMTMGWRFSNVAIPAGSTVISAHLSLVKHNTEWQRWQFDWSGEATANAAPFSPSQPPASRSRTTATVAHRSNVRHLNGVRYQFDDVTTIVQEIINQPGWQAGQPLVLLAHNDIRGWGRTWWRTFDYDKRSTGSNVPQLTIIFRNVLTTANQGWQQRTTDAVPASFGEHGLVTDPSSGQPILYGGNGSGSPYEQRSWAWQGQQWQLLTHTLKPPMRYGVAMGQANGQVILFGGADATDQPVPYTWAYQNGQWQDLNLSPTTSPAARTYAATASDSTSLYLFGGNRQTTLFNDLWRFQNGQWREVVISGSRPVSRTLAALAYDSQRQSLWLFGGQDGAGHPLADGWRFDLATSRWTAMTISKGPPARWGHSLSYDRLNQRLLLIGGTPNDEQWLTHWQYGINTGSWKPLSGGPSLAYHQLTEIPTVRQFLLFGAGQTWSYNLTNLTTGGE